MADRFAIQQALPATGDREDFYATLRELAPTAELLDPATLKVQNSQIFNTSGVPRWVKIEVDHTDFTVAGVSEAITLFSLAAGAVIHHIVTHVSTAWAISGMTTIDLKIGITGTADKYTPAGAIDAEAIGVEGFGPVSNYKPESMSDATNILLTATSNAGNLNTATAGVLDVYVLTSNVFNL